VAQQSWYGSVGPVWGFAAAPVRAA